MCWWLELRQVNTDINKKKIRVLCVGGKTQYDESAMSAGDDGNRFLFEFHQEQGKKVHGVSESEIKEADALLLFLAGSGWDWLERLHLPQGIAGQKPLITILDNYNENFALALLKLGIEEVVSSSDCTPAKLKFSILSAITRFQRNHRSYTGRGEPDGSGYEQTALKALDTLPFGIMFADKDSRVLLMNSAAKRICANGSGVYISDDKRCCAVDPDENGLLHRIISRMSQDHEHSADENHTLKITGKDDSALTMLVVSVGKESVDHGVAIFIDSGGGFFNISEETLKSVYGLTQSEAELLLRMVQGETLAEISEARNVTMHTVRAQLKSVFAKTDTNRQASLIKKVLTGPAVLMQR